MVSGHSLLDPCSTCVRSTRSTSASFTTCARYCDLSAAGSSLTACSAATDARVILCQFTSVELGLKPTEVLEERELVMDLLKDNGTTILH